MKTSFALLLTFAVLPAVTQDYTVNLKPTLEEAYNFETYPFPDDLLVYDQERRKLNLEVEGLTLIQVWSIEMGGKPDIWNRLVAIHNRYKDRGLQTVSINFENGGDAQSSFKNLRNFLAGRPHPMPTYLDFLGYTVDLLKIPGFPTYILVKDQQVVFTTLGDVEEGVDMLENEIERLLDKSKK
ncbi:MAG: hypothetical protein QNK37_33610 [Acidobacteriota bacterium]|nr:hypothetical protein [Acidobacteriota bacterium]